MEIHKVGTKEVSGVIFEIWKESVTGKYLAKSINTVEELKTGVAGSYLELGWDIDKLIENTKIINTKEIEGYNELES